VLLNKEADRTLLFSAFNALYD